MAIVPRRSISPATMAAVSRLSISPAREPGTLPKCSHQSVYWVWTVTGTYHIYM